MIRSKSHADEQSANRSSSVTPNVVFAPRRIEQRAARQLVGSRRNAARARSSRRSQPFASASARAPSASPDGELGERPQPLALGRRRLELPGELPTAAAARVARATSSLVEERRDLLPERARLARRAVVGGRLAHEIQPARGPRARRVEEIAVAADLIGPLERGRASSRRASSSRNGEVRERRGSEPSSSPRTNTTSKLRVRARSRSSTATRPASPAGASRTSVRSSAVTTSSRRELAAERRRQPSSSSSSRSAAS